MTPTKSNSVPIPDLDVTPQVLSEQHGDVPKTAPAATLAFGISKALSQQPPLCGVVSQNKHDKTISPRRAWLHGMWHCMSGPGRDVDVLDQ